VPNFPSTAGGSEPAIASNRVGKRLDGEELRRHERYDDELGDTLTALDRDRIVAVVDQDDLQFAAIARVQNAGSVDDADTITSGETAPRGDKTHVALGQGHGDSRRHERTLSGTEHEVIPRPQVDAGVSRVRRSGKRKTGIQPLERYLHSRTIVATLQKASNPT
jgi:hypothetical protein